MTKSAFKRMLSLYFHGSSEFCGVEAGPYALLGARKNKKQLFVFADAIFRKDRKQNQKKCKKMPNKRGRRKSSRRIRRHIMCRVIFRDQNMSDTIETLAYACSTCLPPYPVFSALSRTHKMCLKSFCSRHAAFCIGGPKYKKQACVLYRLGYELAKNKKQSPLFAFCKAVRTGISQKQKQKELFVFAKKSRKDRP